MTLKQLIDFETLSFDAICEKIRNGEHFSLARYGDGEFNAILGVDGANCDGHSYYPEMGKELADTLLSRPQYHIGLHQNAKIQKETLDWLGQNGLIDGAKYVSNAVFHCATRDGLFDQFVSAMFAAFLKGCPRFVIVAPEYIIKNQKIIGSSDSDTTIEIPGTETYLHLDSIKSKLDCVGFTDSICLISASMTAPLIVDYLYKTYRDAATFIDFGSSFDPFVGVKSRSFHKV